MAKLRVCASSQFSIFARTGHLSQYGLPSVTSICITSATRTSANGIYRVEGRTEFGHIAPGGRPNPVETQPAGQCPALLVFPSYDVAYCVLIAHARLTDMDKQNILPRHPHVVILQLDPFAFVHKLVPAATPTRCYWLLLLSRRTIASPFHHRVNVIVRAETCNDRLGSANNPSTVPTEVLTHAMSPLPPEQTPGGDANLHGKFGPRRVDTRPFVIRLHWAIVT